MPPYEEYTEMIKPLWESAWLTNNGTYHQEFEKQLKEYMKVQNLSLMTNGHMALELAIQAMHLSGEVITTPFTFVSTVHAIVRNGLTPVFCDISMDNYTMDVEKIEELITESTSAIVPVHSFGQVCNIEAIDALAKKYGLKVIYDAAHTFGERYYEKSVASYGDASILSFHATKVFNTIEGGAVIYKEEEYGNLLYGLKNFGIRSEEIIDEIGSNAKLDEFRAAMGICNLLHIEDEIEKRKKVAEHYRMLLQDIDGIKLLKVQAGVKENYAYFPVLFQEEKLGITRDLVYERLKDCNIYARKYFYPSVHKTECYKEKYENCKLPVTEYVSNHILTLPIYADLALEQVSRICKIILDMIK